MSLYEKPLLANHITLFISMRVLCGTDLILQKIRHIQTEYEEYTKQYCQAHRTLLICYESK